MKFCESCGSEIGDDHLFAVCPGCLLQSALRTRNHGTPGPRPEPFIPPKPQASGRFTVRTDFFEKYDILERLAEGGQGDVWKVWDFELRRCVAMKRLHTDAVASQPAVYRFLAEAQIAGQLEHPGVLPIFDVGLDPDGRPFYTTQLLPGTTLADAWGRLPTPPRTARQARPVLELLLRVCDAVAHAHSRGVIHRDLKPTNILVGPFGDVRVIDWGSAHILPEAKNFEQPFLAPDPGIIQTDRTEAIQIALNSPLATARAGQPITMLFMPPEIIGGHADQLGPETDVYSLGVMLYQLFAGRPPYSDPHGQLPEPSILQDQILAGPPPSLLQLQPGLSRDLAAICHKAMAHAKGHRYPDMARLADDLRAVLETRPVRARPAGPALKIQKWFQRNPVYAISAAVVLLVLSGAISFTREVRTERNVARQLTALRGAELASRSGHWRDALHLWDQAENAGYSDSIALTLHRAEAWTVLTEPARAHALLQRLARRPDLGQFRGPVLLRLAEHQLFDPNSAAEGVSKVREAITAGLDPADLALARGLIADSTPEALQCFEQALQLNPYSHAAHRHSLGLQFLLGQHDTLQEHVRLFQVLYPDDPTPVFLQAAVLSINGKLPEGEKLLDSLSASSSPKIREQLKAGLRAFAAAAAAFNLEALLAGDPAAASPLEAFSRHGTVFGFTGYDTSDSPLRVPQLPCVRQGVLAGNEALRQLAIPFLSNAQAAASKVKASWQLHPEALIPALAGLLLDQQAADSSNLLPLKADLFQLAADSPSLLPRLPGLCRFLAAKCQLALITSPTNGTDTARQRCLENLHRAAASNLSASESRAWFELAMQLNDTEAARSFLHRWEQVPHADPEALRARIRLDTAAGAFGNALQNLDLLLACTPDDSWAQDQRRVTTEKIKALAVTALENPKSKP